MNVSRENLPLYLAGAAAICTPVSIAAFEILMGLAFVSIVATRTKWRIPPVIWPLAVFFLWTMVSLVGHSSWHLGYPQVKKFYVFLMLFLVATAFRTVKDARCLASGWALAASLSALWGVVQFYRKYQEAKGAGDDFYAHYITHRITGFMSHWMTFSGHMMMALMIVGALVFFSQWRRASLWLVAAGAIIGVGLLLAETRSMWLGAAAGAAYLLWFWKRWTLIALPAVLALIVVANPFGLGERVKSAFKPHGELDSNAHRAMCRKIGWEMIKAHPFLGVGPEEVGPQHLNYLPPGTRLPLPEGYYGHLHSIYYQYAAERGVPAMLALMWFLGRMLYDFVLALRRGGSRWILHGAIAVMIAVLAGGVYEYNLNDSEVLAMFLAVMACGYVAVYEGEKECKA